MANPDDGAEIPALSGSQMVEVDRAMIEDFGIELIQMMENAGRNLAHLARTLFLDGDPRGTTVLVLAGTGGNGGGALVCARRLATWGASVSVVTTKPRAEFSPVAGHQLDILDRMGVPAGDLASIPSDTAPDLVVDGVIGYSLEGEPRGAASDLIRWANDAPAPVLSLDVPSGVDATTGTVFDPAVRAAATLTLALPKQGLGAEGVESHVGELWLADIGVPPGLYAEPALGIEVEPIFACHEIIRLY